MNIITVILALAIITEWKMDLLYVKNTFLNENLEEDVYMSMFLGFGRQEVL